MNEQKNPLVEAMEQALDNAMLQLPDSSFPDPSTLNYYTFENDRKLFLETEVSFNVMEIVKLIIRWNKADAEIPVSERKPITLYIMSPGGSLAYMWALIDVMLASKTPIYTVNLGIAASSAALIFLAGSKRMVMPTSTVIIHEGSTELEGDASKVLDAAYNYQAEIKQMREYILARTNIQPKVMNKKRKDDWYIDAKTCLEYGICDKIIETLDEIM